MKRAVMSLCLAAAMTAALYAQDKMGGAKAGHSMTMAKTYSGCLERAGDGAFAISHAMEATSAHGKNAMKMSHEEMSKESMSKDGMTFAVSGSKNVDLAKHVGHEVRVTGTPAAEAMSAGAFSVTLIKTIAGSCNKQ